MNALKKYLAEFIGTCVLVLFACGVAVRSAATTPPVMWAPRWPSAW